MFKEEDIQKK